MKIFRSNNKLKKVRIYVNKRERTERNEIKLKKWIFTDFHFDIKTKAERKKIGR